MATQLTPTTQEQHRIAQEAGNDAAQRADEMFLSMADQANAYHAAYNASLAAQQAAPVPALDDDDSTPPTTDAWAEPIWDEAGTSEKWLYEHIGELSEDEISELGLVKPTQQVAPVMLTLDEISEMCLRCDETATEAPSYDGMWK